MPDRQQTKAEHAALLASIQATIDGTAEAARDAKHLIGQSREAVKDSCELLSRIGAQLERR
jgi:hypothetical protein